MRKFRLGDAPNTHIPAMNVLREKGFELGIHPPRDDAGNLLGDDAGIGLWWAKKGDHEFVAENAIALLGLVALWEHRGDEWRRDTDVNIEDEILSAAYPD